MKHICSLGFLFSFLRVEVDQTLLSWMLELLREQSISCQLLNIEWLALSTSATTDHRKSHRPSPMALSRDQTLRCMTGSWKSEEVTDNSPCSTLRSRETVLPVKTGLRAFSMKKQQRQRTLQSKGKCHNAELPRVVQEETLYAFVTKVQACSLKGGKI